MRANKGTPPLNEDSVLFREGRISLGKVCYLLLRLNVLWFFFSNILMFDSKEKVKYLVCYCLSSLFFCMLCMFYISLGVWDVWTCCLTILQCQIQLHLWHHKVKHQGWGWDIFRPQRRQNSNNLCLLESPATNVSLEHPHQFWFVTMQSLPVFGRAEHSRPIQ